jgi:hypothetical protein
VNYLGVSYLDSRARSPHRHTAPQRGQPTEQRNTTHAAHAQNRRDAADAASAPRARPMHARSPSDRLGCQIVRPQSDACEKRGRLRRSCRGATRACGPHCGVHTSKMQSRSINQIGYLDSWVDADARIYGRSLGVRWGGRPVTRARRSSAHQQPAEVEHARRGRLSVPGRLCLRGGQIERSQA